MNIENELARHNPDRPTLLTIGVFDGVHRGHLHLLGHLVARAREKGCPSGVVTFRTHPEKVLGRRDTIPWITTLQERTRLLRAAGADVVVPVTFTRDIAGLSAREFVLLLQKHLNMSGLVLGPDFALGRHRLGDPDYLRKIGEELDFRVEVVRPARLQGEVISSSAIRKLLAAGDVNKVGEMLGRRFNLEGRVAEGDRRGRTLGFPTANIRMQPEQAMPRDGVYATIARQGRLRLNSVTNIGVRPTFDGMKRLVETYIMDFEGDLYGKKLTIDLVARLRDEMRFKNAEELKQQMAKDTLKAREILSTVTYRQKECRNEKNI
jgi:riboflavin kinase/FMN adenylyltransferase